VVAVSGSGNASSSSSSAEGGGNGNGGGGGSGGGFGSPRTPSNGASAQGINDSAGNRGGGLGGGNSNNNVGNPTMNTAALNAQRQANAAAAVAAANAAAAHWPPAPSAVTRSSTPLIRKPVREGELGSDGQPMPSRPGGDTPSNVLWVRVTNVTVPVTLGALYELFGVHGKVRVNWHAEKTIMFFFFF
jgi:hypothetical protein